MAITSIARDWGVDPCIVRITSSNTLSEVGANGYILAQENNIEALNAGPFQWSATDMVLVHASNGWGFFTISADFESLTAFAFTPAVTLPTIVGHLAVYNSTGGNLGEDAATAINGGNIQAGLSGTAGNLISFPATAANGSLIISALNAGGAFNTTIRNSVMGQSTVYSLPDIGAATGGIVVSTAPLKEKMVIGAAAAGGAAAQSFTDAFCTSSSLVVGNWVTQTNPGQIVKIVPGNGSFVVTSTVDIGVGTFSYKICK